MRSPCMSTIQRVHILHFFWAAYTSLHLVYTSSRMKYMLHSDSRGTWMYASLLRSCIYVFHFCYSAYTSYFLESIYLPVHLVYTSSRMKYICAIVIVETHMDVCKRASILHRCIHFCYQK
jgi:hypothetical protein